MTIEMTTIAISRKVKRKIIAAKLHPRETYNEVLDRTFEEKENGKEKERR